MSSLHRCAAGFVLAGAVALGACSEGPTTPALNPSPSSALGNGFPEGGHDYSLHIIGVPKDKTATMDNNSGRRIFVQLQSDNVVTDPGGKNNDGLKKGGGDDQNHIYLCNSSTGENDVNDVRCDSWRATHAGEFGVIDANATDGDGAIFGLPDPCAGDLSTDGCTPTYGIWARALTGGGSAIITTCADETGTGFDGEDDVWCGSNGITLSRQTARKAIEVTSSLLYMTISVNDATDPDLAACIDPDGDATDGLPDQYNVYLFDRCFENYFWNYDNNGLKNLELRFYSAS
jgi:hypothetical protein